MGKIRVKTLGDETLEKKEKKETRRKREAKIAKGDSLRKQGVSLSKEEISSSSDGGRKVTPCKATSDVAKQRRLLSQDRMDSSEVEQVAKKEAKKDHKTHKSPKTYKYHRSKNYQAVAKLVDRSKKYALNEALELLPKIKLSKFDETVELHINTAEPGINGTLALPHGTGKKIRIAIADENLIKEIESGKINFDILLAEPQIMPKLAKVARVLGPRGLMPNPKNGTITATPEQTAKKFEAGEIRFKTEAKTPIIHLAVGKLSFGNKKLLENIKTVFDAIPTSKIQSATLKSTMSPGIKINFTTI